MEIVLQKFIADSGFCSRRQAEELIKDGRVTLNGEKARFGLRVVVGDIVQIDGKKIGSAEEKIYIKLNKPRGFICTNRQFKGEQNIFDLVDVKERLFAVGRLDKDSRGMVLLTNDGELTQELTHPSFEHEKEYEVSIGDYKMPDADVEGILRRLKNGIDIGDGDGVVKAKEVKLMGRGLFKMVLTEGKKRQIRRMFNAMGLHVFDLKRTSISGLKLGDLEEGKWAYLDKEEIEKLRK